MKTRLIANALLGILLFVGEKLSTAQNYAETYQQFKSVYSGSELQFKIDSLLYVIDPETHLRAFVRISGDYAYQFIQKGNLPSGIHYLLEAAKQLEQYGEPDELYLNTFYGLGMLYFHDSQYQEALNTLEKVTTMDLASPLVADAYAYIGRIYAQVNDLYRSIDYFEKGLTLFEKLGHYDLIAIHLVNMANVYYSLGDKKSLDIGLKLLTKSDSLDKHFPLEPANKRVLIAALGNLYTAKTHYDFDKAYYYHRLNLDISSNSDDSTNIARSYNNLAYVNNIEKSESAYVLVQQGLKYAQDKLIRSQLYDNLSHYYLNKNDLPNALKTINKALNTNLNTSLEVTQCPSIYQLADAVNQTHALYCLKEKIRILLKLYKAQGSDAHLQNALNHADAADTLLGLIDDHNQDVQSRLFWRKEASQVYLLGTLTAHLLGESGKSFYFMEKNKALLLAEDIAKNRAYARLPMHVAAKKVTLKKAVLRLEGNQPENKEALFQAKSAYQAYIDSISTVYQDYFQGQLEVSIVSLNKTQKHLGRNELVVSYIWNEIDKENERVVGLVASKNEAFTFEIKNVEALDSLINAYQYLMSKPLETQQENERFAQVSSQLYRSLFPSAELRELVQNKNLFIIPDGILQQIPFESLIIDDQTESYLLTTSDVSYLYSQSFQQYSEGMDLKTDKTFIGYSPADFSHMGLSNLDHSKEELSAVQALMGGDVRTGGQASKQHFLNESHSYEVIHLATHASAEAEPWIAFAEEKMTLRELYTYQNRAELVTLSACNTLSGELAQGEGVISLSRGFFYGGARSVVSSLWSVNDRSTRQIMTDFYANLKAGQNKSKALNNAKRKYLQNHSLSDRSPYYWSSFVLVGNVEPLRRSRYEYYFFVALAACLSVFFVAFLKKKKIVG